MHSVRLLLLSAYVLLLGADALTLRKRDAPSVIALDTERSDIDDPVGRDVLRRRDGHTVSQSLDNKVQ